MALPAGLSNVVAVAAGQYHSVALKRDGTVLVWGGNTYGPEKLSRQGLGGVVAISSGDVQNPRRMVTQRSACGTILTANGPVDMAFTMPCGNGSQRGHAESPHRVSSGGGRAVSIQRRGIGQRDHGE